MQRAQRNYHLLAKHSVEVPLQKQIQRQNEQLAKKAKQRQQAKDEQKQKSLLMSLISSE